MPITIAWDNEAHTVIRATYNGRWTWDDVYNALHEQRDLIASVTHIVDVIVDVRRVNFVPDGFILQIKRVGDMQMPNRGQTVFVSGNPLLKGMYSIAAKLYPEVMRNNRLVPTLEEAYAVIDRSNVTQAE